MAEVLLERWLIVYQKGKTNITFKMQGVQAELI